MRVRILAVCFLLVVLLVVVACDGSGAPTPSPVATEDASKNMPQPPPALPSPPATYLTSAESPRVSLKADEAITLFPARILSRTYSQESQYRGLSTPVPTSLLKLEFTNNTHRDVAKFTGTLFINNPSGDLLGSYRINYEKPVKAGATAEMDYTIYYNIETKETTSIREAPLQDLKLEFRVRFINYTEGNQQEIEINS